METIWKQEFEKQTLKSIIKPAREEHLYIDPYYEGYIWDTTIHTDGGTTINRSHIEKGMIQAVLAYFSKKKDPSETWMDTSDCDKCGIETMHTFYSAGHERDSSGDYKTCTICGHIDEI